MPNNPVVSWNLKCCTQDEVDSLVNLSLVIGAPVNNSEGEKENCFPPSQVQKQRM